MNTKQKIVWIIYLVIFAFVWYVEFTDHQGNTAIGSLALSGIVAIPAIILHKILKK